MKAFQRTLLREYPMKQRNELNLKITTTTKQKKNNIIKLHIHSKSHNHQQKNRDSTLCVEESSSQTTIRTYERPEEAIQLLCATSPHILRCPQLEAMWRQKCVPPSQTSSTVMRNGLKRRRYVARTKRETIALCFWQRSPLLPRMSYALVSDPKCVVCCWVEKCGGKK